jgi:shikimate dehydrogenase
MRAESANRTYLAGLVGAGIQHSSSPSMHMDEGQSLGLQISYELLDLDLMAGGAAGLASVLDHAEQRGFTGLNVTYPSKQAVIPLLHELSPEAQALHSVNTVLFRDGRRIGHNTDWWGFAESFRRELSEARRDRVVQFGAGGAGAAVAHALLTVGAGHLAIIDTDEHRAQGLAAALRERFGESRASASAPFADAMALADGAVNTTPLGMAKYPGMAVPAELLRPDLWVADIVYFPLETELLREARNRGCRTMSGGGMAVFQAVGAFRLFTGREPDPSRMLRHFSEM